MTEGPDRDQAPNALPGNILIWVLIISELLVFGSALVAFLVERLLHMQEFRAGAILLHPLLGTLNMAILLTSGLAAALALGKARHREMPQARGLLFGAALLGGVFIAIKLYEYGDIIAVGKSMNEGVFFPLYFLITGFHAAHVVAGIVVLLLLTMTTETATIEAGVAFWHMVDLVWVMVFPVVYLMS